MWTFNYTGTPSGVDKAIAADPPPADAAEAVQHGQFQKLVAIGIQSMTLPEGKNGIMVNARGTANDDVFHLTFTLNAVILHF